jgi:hypothetical protein
MNAVGDAAVADRLGAEGCISLIEQAARTSDPIAITNAQRQVAEVQAGIRPLPQAGQARSPVFDTYLALRCYLALAGKRSLLRAPICRQVSWGGGSALRESPRKKPRSRHCGSSVSALCRSAFDETA